MLLGLFFLAVAINVALFVIVEFIFGTTVGVVTASAASALSLLVWYVLPFLNRRRLQRQEATRG
jgi:Flp pilus assembly protein TadB